MKEIRDIIIAYKLAVKESKKTALATVVHVEGSSYRRPGARMLVTEDGQLTGAISGGCLEGDALRKAQLAIADGKVRLVTYDTTDEDDARFGIQLGCNGIVHILFEPVDAAVENHPLALLEKIVSARQPAVLTTLFSLQKKGEQKGTVLLHTVNGATYKSAAYTTLPEAVYEEAAIAFTQKKSLIKEYPLADGATHVLAAYIKPAPSLIVAGAGNDVQPLVVMASSLGWEVIIVDGRATHATARRFPLAHQIIVAKPEAALLQLSTAASAFFVLMTHNYDYDIRMLRGLLLQGGCRYIGTLGPQQKLQRMLDALAEEGIVPAQPDILHGPVGLDIGAETAEEIALSIMAEIKMVMENRNGAPLKAKKEAIHGSGI